MTSLRFFAIILIFGISIQTRVLRLSAQGQASQVPAASENTASINLSLMQEAWNAYEAKDYSSALKYIDRCIAIFDARAKQQQASLADVIPLEKINLYWALNDAASAKFLKAKIYQETNKPEEAKEIYMDIIKNYSYAMAYDRRGWYWNVAKAAQNKLGILSGTDIDCGDCSSAFIISMAWQRYNNGNYKDAIKYANKCVEMYQPYALLQQKALTRAPKGKEALKYWALNDVAVGYYLAGMSNLKLGNNLEARAYFNFLADNLSFGQCWDSKGWYWVPADAAVKELKKLR